MYVDWEPGRKLSLLPGGEGTPRFFSNLEVFWVFLDLFPRPSWCVFLVFSTYSLDQVVAFEIYHDPLWLDLGKETE